MISKIKLQNILSFKDTELELRNLNILIGPNGSGKSNFLQIVGLLQALPNDLGVVFRNRGRAPDWRWRGKGHDPSEPVGIRVEIPYGPRPFVYLLHLSLDDQPSIEKEVLKRQRATGATDFCVQRLEEAATVSGKDARTGKVVGRDVDLDPYQSVLAEIKDPKRYPELRRVAREFERIKLYRERQFGSLAGTRQPQPADLPNDFLLEDSSNLGLVLSRMERDGSIEILERYTRRFLPSFRRLGVHVAVGTVQIVLHEKSLSAPIPVARISDGTIHFLFLMAILCNPSPPAMVCIEEPEVGLHPDALRLVAEAMREAASSTQVVVTTHSDALVDHFSDEPESIVVCERDSDGSTQFRRLDRKQLAVWLDEYRLGELWRRGEIGGNP